MRKKDFLSYLSVGLLSSVTGIGLFLWQHSQQAVAPEQRSAPYVMNEQPVGSKAPDLTLKTIRHKQENLYAYKNEFILINFWATWCAPCRKEMPILDKLNKENDNLQVLGFSFDEDFAIFQYLQKTPISYPLFLSTPDAAKLNALFGNKTGGIPYTVLLNKSHQIVMTHSGEITEQQILPLLK